MNGCDYASDTSENDIDEINKLGSKKMKKVATKQVVLKKSKAIDKSRDMKELARKNLNLKKGK